MRKLNFSTHAAELGAPQPNEMTRNRYSLLNEKLVEKIDATLQNCLFRILPEKI